MVELRSSQIRPAPAAAVLSMAQRALRFEAFLAERWIAYWRRFRLRRLSDRAKNTRESQYPSHDRLSMPQALSALQLLRALDAAERAVEGAQRQVSGRARQLQHQAIGKAQSRLPAKLVECRHHCGRLLQNEAVVFQHALKGLNELGWGQPVCAFQDPYRFNQGHQRDPSAALDECFRGGGLARIVSNDQTNQNVRIKGAHACAASRARCPLSFL